MKLLILLGSHLATAPRPQKEAEAARDAGWEVSIRGTWWTDQLAQEDLEIADRLGVDFAPVADIRPGARSAWTLRFKQRLGRELMNQCGLRNGRAFGLGGPELLQAARSLRADLTMVHSEAGLWVASQLLKEGFAVGADFEDWFSADFPAGASRRSRDFLVQLEHEALHRANPILTTTQVMAEELARSADSNRIPVAIPNAFPWSQGPHGVSRDASRDLRDPEALSLCWFSQTIGPGRGLETLAYALAGVTGNWQLHLRGYQHSYFQDWFERTFPKSLRERIVVHSTVPNASLAAVTASHDIGLALETTTSRSRDLTATNKIFEYLRCGIGVFATDTAGQREVLDACPDAGRIVPQNSVEVWCRTLQELIDDRALVTSMKAAAAAAGETVWDWERHRPVLLQALRSGLRPTKTTPLR